MQTNRHVISALHSLIEQGHAVVLADRRAPSHLAKAPIDLRPDARNLPSGWHAHTTSHAELDRWGHTADQQGITLNGGIALSGSYAVVDVDTREAVDAWHDLAESYGEAPIPLTVRSPGKRDDDGNWVHRDGGHVYLKIPAHLDVSAFPGTVTLPGDIDIKLGGGWVASPPSVRREGAYEWTGADVADFPDWLEDELAYHAPQPRTASTAPDGAFAERIATWEADQDWASLLAPLGWTPSGRRDPRCGCDVYRRDGGSSNRGGIAHDGTCVHSDSPAFHAFSTGDDGPLGMYMSREGTQRATMLRVCALARYDGDMGACIRTEGLSTRTPRRSSLLPSATTPVPTQAGGQGVSILDSLRAHRAKHMPAPTPQNRPTIAVEAFSDSPRGTSTPTAPNPSTTATDPIPTIVRQTPRSKGWDFPEETVCTSLYAHHITSTTERPIMPQHSLMNPVHPLPRVTRPIGQDRWLCSDGQTRDVLVDGTLASGDEARDHLLRLSLGVPTIDYASY